MKLLRYGPVGQERPGLMDCHMRIRDLSHVLPDLTATTLSPQMLDRLALLDPEALPRAPDGVRIGPCIGGTRNFLAIGLNYVDHAVEANMQIPTEPVVFNKAPSSLSGANDAISIPPGTERLDWEIELAMVIHRRAYQVTESQALSHIAGYCICNDVSERVWQLERQGQWAKGKSAPGFGPLGPWLVTTDEIPDPLDLTLRLEVNGEQMQCGFTSTMIFHPAYLISYLSKFMVLEPGDVITTGTPAGVGMASGRYLQRGDRLRLTITGLGEQCGEVV